MAASDPMQLVLSNWNNTSSLRRMFRKIVIAVVLLPIVITGQQAANTGFENYTSKLKLTKGLVFVCSVSNGHHNDGSAIIGDYQSVSTVTEVSDKGFGGSWNMTYPANTTGQAFYPNDPNTLKVSIYGWSGSPPAGYATWWRVSDALYKALKSGKKTAFDFDGYSTPGSIQKVAEEDMAVLVNERKVRLHTIKGKTPQGWFIWFIDNPAFPMMIKIESSIVNWFVGSFNYPGESAKDLLDQLKQKGVATTHGILFAFNSADLTQDSKPVLNAVADFMKANPKIKIEIEGHTDNIGGAKANLELSQKRAESVKNYIMRQSGASADRFIAKGMGMSQPVADNSKPEGRTLNRRVVFRELQSTTH